ncbi:hypothetical protein [Streptomyces meridianus]|uniref:Uncharacterized protein n=1 Tax=Streptomyces meridianus TaxID=2938945 RepID=A0ABT0X8V3_9ACTN|nr:hypothetical protein [Streptomyces meridianus]MCM2578358.1 hypothetical protein [Streptomyces meridianus]
MNTPLGAFLDFAVVTGIALVVLLPPVVGALREHRVTRQIRRAERRCDTNGTPRASGPAPDVACEPGSRPNAGAGAVTRVQSVQLCGG